MLRLCYQIFMIHIIGLTAFQNGDRENYMTKVIGKKYNYRNAWSKDINLCLFDEWVKDGILGSQVVCDNPCVPLCYGPADRSQALFISCYNTTTRIPAFTAHVVRRTATEASKPSKRPPWKTDTGNYSPSNQAKDKDYKKEDQFKNYPLWKSGKETFCARGHLTPVRAFETDEERNLTQILTNAAPQWQKFNNGNWKILEAAVTQYATDNKGVKVFVVTGTGGKTIYDIGPMKAPKYLWKAVCANGQSIVFVAENNVGEISNTKEKIGTCLDKKMQRAKGIIRCYSLEVVKGIPEYGSDGYEFPKFTRAKCKTNKRGAFLDKYLKFK